VAGALREGGEGMKTRKESERERERSETQRVGEGGLRKRAECVWGGSELESEYGKERSEE
jgi:hypothetical protein